MPLTTKDALYTDVDPNVPSELLDSKTPQRVLTEGDPDARYLLCGAGGTIPDDIAQRFKLESHASTSTVETAVVHADLAAINRQTYADNAQTFGGVHKPLPASTAESESKKGEEKKK